MFPYCLLSQGIAILASRVHLQSTAKEVANISESRNQFLDASSFILQSLQQDDSILPQMM